MFDAYLFPLYLAERQSVPDLPEFLAASAPKRARHNRAEDLLFLLLTFSGRERLPAPECEALFQESVKLYFNSNGTVTSGLRSIAEQINSALLERNQRSKDSPPLVAVVNLAVLHHDMLYMLHIGPTHSLALTHQHVEDNFDNFGSGRGAGVSRAPTLRYFQDQVQPGDVLVLCANPPAGWTGDALSIAPQLTIDHLRRRLLSPAGPELLAGVIQFQKGNGQLHRLRLRTSLPPSAQPSVQPSAASAEPAASVPAAPPQAPVSMAATPPPAPAPLPAQPAPLPPLPVIQSAPAPAKPPSAPQTDAQGEPSRISRAEAARLRATTSGAAAPVSGVTHRPRQPVTPARPSGPTPRQRLAKFWFASKTTRQHTADVSRITLSRVLPGASDALPSLSPAAMVFTALVIPLLVVAIAITVYVRKGMTEQHQLFLQQAQQLAEQAPKEKDSAKKRSDWTQALMWVEKAEKYGQTDESRALSSQAQQALDNMDQVLRIDMRPAILGGFASSVKITKMLASDTDVYALDSSQGRVMHIRQTVNGYEVDPQFKCGPGPAGGGIIISNLIDIVLPPSYSPNRATVLGLDDKGNIVYCAPDEDQLSAVLPQPQNYWGRITGMTMYKSRLFVLDKGLSSIQVFDPDESLGFGSIPKLFFGSSDDRPKLDDVVELAAYDEEIYMLHSDGKMSRCTYNSFTPVSCIDPIPYSDERQGHDATPLNYKNTKFIRMMQAQPYSLYILDAQSAALYHFSLSLNLQQVLSPNPNGEYPLPEGEASAFAITPELTVNRRAFIAYGNEVYYGALP